MSAAALALLGASMDARAVAFGAATVRSTLGEPLRAEIEVPQISSEEEASLQVNMASPQAFRAAGLDYTQALSGARITLQRRANGEAYLRIVSDRPINEPFISVVIEASWANGGHIVRDYTMLVDPPAASTAPTAPPAVTPAEIEAPAPPEAAAPPAPPPVEAPPPPAEAPAPPAGRIQTTLPSGGGQITVQPGNTAYSIANANLPEGVSLDQMLQAMLRANPQAFINGNVNLMRAGAVLKLPTAEQANALPPKMAQRAVMAQAHNFNAYRRSAAQNVRGVHMAAAGRRASGGVRAQVQENRAPASSPDRLRLSRGGSNAAKAETAAAQSRQAKDQASRVAELQRNINEINAVASQSASGPAAAASAPGISVPIGAIPGASAAASSAVAAASPASAPVKKSPLKPRPAPPPPPPPEPGFLDWLMDNLSLIGGGLLIALLAGGLFYLRRRKKKPASLDSSLNNSNSLSPDSAFFNASGGQRVNTQEANGPGSTSLAYSPSQLDAAGDVDPVAEADVYLAYGRDAQAEEILKEALRAHPERIAIHRKLAEIYAKRRDARALQVIAAQAHGATHGQGEDWQAIAALGSQLEPDNPLYKPGAAPAPAAAPAAPARGNRTPYFGADTEPQTALLDPKRDSLGTPTQPPSGVDLDLDLGLPPVLHTPAAPSTPAAHPVAAPAPHMAVADLDPGLDFTPPPTPTPALQPSRPAAPALAHSASNLSDMMEFDMDALSISPDSRSGAELKADHHPDAAAGDPLDNKLALAHEFNAVGDRDGARALIKEVIAEASGSLKTRAERFLAELD